MTEYTQRQVFEQALKDFNAGQAAQAARACREALGGAPDSVDFLTLLGASLIAQKRGGTRAAATRGPGGATIRPCARQPGARPPDAGQALGGGGPP